MTDVPETDKEVKWYGGGCARQKTLKNYSSANLVTQTDFVCTNWIIQELLRNKKLRRN